MADDELMDDVPDADTPDTSTPAGGGLVEKVKDLASAAGAKISDVAGSVGDALAPAAQTAGTVAGNVGHAARETAQNVAGTVADTVTTAAHKVGIGGDAGQQGHSGGVPETGASVGTGHMQNLPGQGAGHETM